jgi:hypothetical protein
MKQIKRPAPNPEWVQMYRLGIPTPKISAGAGVAETTVRYHLAIAAGQDPGLRAAHQAALPPAAPRVTEPGERNMEEILAFYEAEGRLPVASQSVRETALAGWLARRRVQAAAGTLSPAYAALDSIPGWRAIRPNAMPTQPGGSSDWLRSLPTWPPATSGRGSTRPTTGTNGSSGSGCTPSASTTGPGS